MEKFLSVLIIFISFAQVFTLEEINCTVQSNFLVNIRNKHKAIIFDGRLFVQFSREKFKVYTYKNSEDVNFIINETLVNFQGKMLIDNFVDKIKPINQVFHTRILGVSVLQDISCYDTILTQCQILLPRNKTDSPKFPFEVENEILHLAASCLNIELTEKIGSLLPLDFSKSTDFYNFGPLSVQSNNAIEYSCLNHSITEEKKKLKSMQLALNTIIDVAVIEVRKILLERNLGIIKIPDVFEPYHVFTDTFIQMSGYFNATNGTFEDFSTIKRTSEVVIDQRNQKLSIAFGFGLETAKIHFGFYKAKYGVLSMSGNISATVKTVDAVVKLSMDFEKNPCKAKLEYFRFSHFDNLLISISGNKVISPVASKIVTSVINKWRKEISEFVENIVGKLIETEFHELNCEIYRNALSSEC
ncbi:uncharacterized protein LOC127285647 [Leptopilina boulardi]|uniref:uncharacterized protein LOC127285647 n=1 Tax=Leptopilina boulardi TaxID=63433 RepID=UPI0021F53E8E|nr:uncharacterized protein LOC127285647 [Leptopilina boulardi]